MKTPLSLLVLASALGSTPLLGQEYRSYSHSHSREQTSIHVGISQPGFYFNARFGQPARVYAPSAPTPTCRMEPVAVTDTRWVHATDHCGRPVYDSCGRPVYRRETYTRYEYHQTNARRSPGC